MRSIASLAVATAFVLGCSDPAEPDHTGSMSFDYSGSLPDSPAGSFSVVGAREPFPDDFVDGAGGFTGGTAGHEYAVISGERRDGPLHLEIMLLGPHSVGVVPMCDHSQPLPTHCVSSGYWEAGSIFYYFGSVSDDPPPYPEMQVTITSLTDRRMTGTFEGVAVGYCAICGASGASDTQHLTNGRFDVPYR